MVEDAWQSRNGDAVREGRGMPVFKKSATLTEEEVVQWLREMRRNPHIPLSGFAVSCIVRASVNGEGGYYFAGVNVENMDNRLSTHGEEGAIAAMTTALGKNAEIEELWVMGAPQGIEVSDINVPCCGKCRQQIAGFAAEEVRVHSVALNGDRETATVGALLPDRFTFRHYIDDSAARQKGTPAPSSAIVESRLARKEPLTEEAVLQWLKDLEAVDYASKTSQVMVLQLDNGWYVAGVRVEEAAFVSISAAQSAVAVAQAAYAGSRVKKVFVYSSGREEKTLAEDAFLPLPMSDLQVLREVAVMEDIPVVLFARNGRSVNLSLIESATLPLVSRSPVCKVPSSPAIF